ncbi:hypothetical protein BH18ACI4_BH18ACI4_25250 [soil metagenome]
MPQRIFRVNRTLVRDVNVLKGFIPPGDSVTDQILRTIL